MYEQSPAARGNLLKLRTEEEREKEREREREMFRSFGLAA